MSVHPASLPSAVAAAAKAVATRASTHASSTERWELYRLLGEPVRLRLLALAAEEELSVGELAELLGEGQPNVSRHAAPLRQARLLLVRKDGTRTLVRFSEGASSDPVIADALMAGRALCTDDGSLQRVAEVVRARDAASRAFFARERGDEPFALPSEIGAYLAALAPLIPHRRLAVDAGTGEGGLLEILAPVFEHVVAFDREQAQLARCSARVSERGWRNVEIAHGEVGSEEVLAKVLAHGGADVVFAARVLHHAARPASAVASLAALARPGGAVVLIDYAHHEDDAMREQADLWLGFDAADLRRFEREAGLDDAQVRPLPSPYRAAPNRRATHRDAHLAWQVLIARRPLSPAIDDASTPTQTKLHTKGPELTHSSRKPSPAQSKSPSESRSSNGARPKSKAPRRGRGE